MLVATQDHQGLEAERVGAVRIAQAVLEWVFCGQERHDPVARRLRPEVDLEVSEAVFLLLADRAVGEEDEGLLASQSANPMVGVDPGFHSGPRA